MSGKTNLTFKNIPVDIKLTFALRYKLISAGVNYSDGLITSSTPIEDFCKCWSILLNQDYDPKDTEKFLSSFNMLELVNPYYISVLSRDGVIANNETTSDTSEDPKEKKENPKKK